MDPPRAAPEPGQGCTQDEPKWWQNREEVSHFYNFGSISILELIVQF